MSLQERRIPQDLPALEARWLEPLVARAGHEWERWTLESPAVAPGFVPAAYHEAASILRWFQQEHGTRGSWFCEWGSGLGVVTMIADALGWQSLGIEIEPELVRRATAIAREFGSQAGFIEGSFLPEGTDVRVEALGEPSWLDLRSDDTYERLQLEIADFELIYVYPWPGERWGMLELFEDEGRPGAWLLSYYGAGEWHLWQKQGVG